MYNNVTMYDDDNDDDDVDDVVVVNIISNRPDRLDWTRT